MLVTYIKNCLPKFVTGLHRYTYFCVFALFVPAQGYAQQQVQIYVEGEVKPKCGFAEAAVSAQVVGNDIAFVINPEDENWAAQTAKVGVALSCNTPFTLEARSSQGGLLNTADTARVLSDTFTTKIPYSLGVTLTTDDPAMPLVLNCTSQNMHGPDAQCNASSNTQAAIDFGAGVGDVSIQLSGSAGFPTRGSYHDTLVLALAFQ